MNNPAYRPDIDGLRAVAVVSVLLFHLGIGGSSGGFVGVDVFFVISGYLITRLIVEEIESNGTFRFGNFYVRRARRLFPALFVTLFVSATFAILLFSPAHLESFGSSLLHAIASVANFKFWAEAGYFDAAADVKPLLHTWSLSVEEQFYLIWPATLLLLSSFRSRWSLPAGLVIMGIASLLLNIFLIEDPGFQGNWIPDQLTAWLTPGEWITDKRATIFYLLPFRVFEFTIGAGLVWIARLRQPPNILMELCVAFGLALIFFSVVSYDEETWFPGTAALVPCVGAALCIFGGRADYLGRLLSNPICVFIGLISYSLYLIHWPLIVFWQYYTFQILEPLEKLAIFLFSVVLATAMYHYVERPYRKRSFVIEGADRQTYPDSGPFGVGMFALTLLLVVPASWMISGNGWVWRVDDVSANELLPPDVSVGSLEGLDKETPWTRAYRVGGNDNKATKVLVLGDSHADQLMGGAKYLSVKYKVSFTFLTFTGCPPIFGTYKVYGAPRSISTEGRKQVKCREQTGKWEEFIHKSKFDYVVLSSRWNWLFEPTEYYGTRQRRDLLVDKSDPRFTVADSKRVFFTFLDSTVQSIHDSGAQAIIFGQVPHAGRDLEGCDNVPKYLFTKSRVDIRCNYVPKHYVLDRSMFSNQTIQKVASKNGAISVMPTEFFCNGASPFCQTRYKGVRLKDDDDHINAFGSVFLAKHWEESESFPFK